MAHNIRHNNKVHPLSPTLDPQEVDRLLADSPVPAIRSSDGVVTINQTPGLRRQLPRIAITEEDLALLDETGDSIRVPHCGTTTVG